MKYINKKVVLPSLVGIAAFTGIVGGSAMSSIAASAATPMHPGSSNSARPDMDENMGRFGTMEHVAVLGDTATKIQAAAQAAVNAGTVGSNATAATNAVYETHVRKADGTVVSVKMDANYGALSIDTMPKPAMVGHRDLN